jgi:hypothetical protein
MKLIEQNKYKDFLINRGFQVKKSCIEANLYMTDIFKKLNNGLTIEMCIVTTDKMQYKSHTFSIIQNTQYSEIAIESFEEFKQLVTILDK